MQEMSHHPAAASIGSRIVANSFHGLAAGTTALMPVYELVPAGSEEISAAAAAAFATDAMHFAAIAAAAQEELKLAGDAFLEIAQIYQEVDGIVAKTLA